MTNVANRIEWDFALELAGITPEQLPMGALADYLAQWAGLLGAAHRPIYKGAVKGSVVLRAQVGAVDRASARARLRNAANDESVQPFLYKIEELLVRDGLRRAKVIDKKGEVLQTMRPALAPLVAEITVTDSAEIDGRVFRLSGKDSSTSVGLTEDVTGRVITVETSSDGLARDFARHFKGALLRVSVHGTWTRHPQDGWQPKRLVADSFEVLEEVPLLQTMRELRAAPGNEWAQMSYEKAIAEWELLHYGSHGDPKEAKE